jgi:hypothetical protein
VRVNTDGSIPTDNPFAAVRVRRNLVDGHRNVQAATISH